MDKQKFFALLAFLSCLTTLLFAQAKPLSRSHDYDYIKGVQGTAINASGIVLAGGSIWTRAGAYQSLGSLGGGSTNAVAINAAGQIVGSSRLPDGTTHAFLWTESGGMQDLGSVLGGNSAAGVVNASGQVAGNSWSADGSTVHAFFWSTGSGMVDLGTLPGDSGTNAAALNDNGEVVGLSINPGQGNRAFQWTVSNGIQLLPGLGGNASMPVGVGNNGIVGGWSVLADGTQHAAVWTADGAVHDLGTLPGDTFSLVSYVNAAGHMTGYSGYLNHSKRGAGPMYATFYWANDTGMTDIGIPHAPQHYPFGFNNRDQMLVYYGNIFIWGPTGVEAFAGNGNKIPTSGTLSDAGLFLGVGQRLYAPVMHVALTSSSNPSQLGQSVTLTAKVSSVFGAPPDGEQVTIGSGKNVLGTATLSEGTASISTSSIKAGSHNIIATYGGDGNFVSSDSPKLVQVVNK